MTARVAVEHPGNCSKSASLLFRKVHHMVHLQLELPRVGLSSL